jgi:hypothetical protein
MLEVQNRALIKSARERAQRIGNLEHELEQANRALERLKTEVERLKSEREFYHKRALALEQDVRVVTEAAAKYSLWGQTLVRESSIPMASGSASSEFGPQTRPAR